MAEVKPKKQKAPSPAVLRMLKFMADTGSVIQHHADMGRFGRGGVYWPHSNRDKGPVTTRPTLWAAKGAGYIVDVPKSPGRSYWLSEYALTDAGRAAYEANASTAESTAEVVLAVTRYGPRPDPYTYSRQDSGLVGSLVEIVRETKSRAYVRVVKKALNPYDDCIHGGEGRSDGAYVDSSDILYRGVTAEQYESMRRAELERNEWKKSVLKQMEDELAPIRKRYADREAQKAAEVAETLGDIMKGKEA